MPSIMQIGSDRGIIITEGGTNWRSGTPARDMAMARTLIYAMNLRTTPWLQARFDVVVGISYHSRHPIHAPLAAAVAGSFVIEEHDTIENRLSDPDQAFAVTPDELPLMAEGIRDVERTLGDNIKGVLPCENELAAYARRGVQAVCRITRRKVFSEGDNISVLRPSLQKLGVHPRNLGAIEGGCATHDIGRGEAIQTGDGEPL